MRIGLAEITARISGGMTEGNITDRTVVRADVEERPHMAGKKVDRISRIPELAMLFASLVVVVLVALLSYQSEDQAKQAREQGMASREVHDLSEELISSLKDAETGERGFLLTGGERYLEPYNHAVSSIPLLLQQLHDRSVRAPDLVGSVTIEPLVRSLLNKWQRTIELRRAGKVTEAVTASDIGEEKGSMDELRRQCGAISERADSRRAQFSTQIEKSNRRLRLVSTLGSALLFVFVGLSAVTIFKGMVRREKLIEESYRIQTLLATTLSSIADAVISTDVRGNITFLNATAEKITGWTAEQAMGVHISEVFRIIDETSRLKADNPLEKALSDGVTVGLANHTNLISKSGQEVSIDDSAAPIKDQSGKINGAVVIFRDITEKRRVQKRLTDTVSMLKRSNEELEQFALVASHDLRSPVRSLSTVAQLLSRRFSDGLGPEGTRLVGYLSDGATRMARLVDDLLAFSKADIDESPTEPVHMDQIIEEALANLDAEIKQSGARIVCSALPVVRAHRTRMLQIVQNLIGNALKYRGADAPVIEISAVPNGAEWLFSIRDNGMGIDPKFLEEIFKPFKRLHGSEYVGSGIGLATCKKIITTYGGRLWAESEQNCGSTFLFTLPAYDEGLGRPLTTNRNTSS